MGETSNIAPDHPWERPKKEPVSTIEVASTNCAKNNRKNQYGMGRQEDQQSLDMNMRNFETFER